MQERVARSLCLCVMSFAALLVARTVRAGCNTIPPAAKTYASTRGFVDRALAGPTDEVTITLRPECLPSPSASEPDHFESGDTVTLLFESQSPATPTVPMTFPAPTVDVKPHQLRFKIPITAKATLRDFGVAGPVTITVKDKNDVTVAKIDSLYQATSGCDKDAPSVFGKFTVLPKDNDFEDKASKDDFLVMTLDGNQNLLIPFQHKAKPSSDKGPTAHLEQGWGAFPAGKNNLDIGQVLAQAKAGGAKDYELVQAFTPEGFPLPPVAGVDDAGALYGTVDAEHSVIRVLGGGTRYDLRDQATDVQDDATVVHPKLGPIVMKNSMAKKTIHVSRCIDSVLIGGMKSSSSLTVVTADEKLTGDENGDGDDLDVVAAILGTRKAGRDCQVKTKTAVATADTGVGALPFMGVDGNLAAVIRDDSVVRIFNAKGQPVAKDLTPVAVKTPGFDHDSVVVGGQYVFFRQQPASGDPVLTLVDTQGPAIVNPTPDVKASAAVIDRAHYAVAARGSSGNAQFYDADAASAASLTVPAKQIAMLDHSVSIIVPESSGVPTNNDGDTNDDVLMFAVVSPPTDATPVDLGVAADMVAMTSVVSSSSTENWIVFRTPESAEGSGGLQCTKTTANGCDLNGDDDSNDLILRARSLKDGTTVDIGPAEEFVVAGDLIAFRAPPDDLMTVYDLAVGARVETGIPARPSNDLGYEWMHPYGIRGRTIFFISEQPSGSGPRRVFTAFDVDTFALQFFPVMVGPTAGATPAPLPPVAITSVSGAPMVAVQTTTTDPTVLFGDRDGDGMFDSFDRCVDVPDRSNFDDDLDGLGTACDRELCTPFSIPAVARATDDLRAAQRTMVDAGVTYVEQRAQSSMACLAQLKPSSGGAPLQRATRVCRGYIVGSAEVDPADPSTAKLVRRAREAFRQALSPVHAASTIGDVDDLIRHFSAAAIAVTHSAFGDGATPGGSGCSEALANATAIDLRQVLIAVSKYAATAPPTETFVRHPESAEALTIAVPLPQPPVTACDPIALRDADACGSTPADVARCVRCVALRRAVDAVMRVYGIATPVTP
jgi:hypothetical protein